MTFGEKLQALRKARGWSQEELATQINVSRQALSKWESGASVPDTENVVALSRLFGVSTDYLLLERPQRRPRRRLLHRRRASGRSCASCGCSR